MAGCFWPKVAPGREILGRKQPAGPGCPPCCPGAHLGLLCSSWTIHPRRMRAGPSPALGSDLLTLFSKSWTSNVDLIIGKDASVTIVGIVLLRNEASRWKGQDLDSLLWRTVRFWHFSSASKWNKILQFLKYYPESASFKMPVHF